MTAKRSREESRERRHNICGSYCQCP